MRSMSFSRGMSRETSLLFSILSIIHWEWVIGSRNGVTNMENEAAAMDFLDEYNGLFLDSEELSTEKSNSINNGMFENWRKDTLFLNELSSSHAALHITLWRYRNPTSLDRHCCAVALNVSMEDIEKWWNVVDFLNCENNGHFQPIRLDEKTLGTAIKQICQQYI